MQDKQLREATSQWFASLDALRSEMSGSESRSLIREVFAAFLLLRWADLQDAEQEAMAVFEDRGYHARSAIGTNTLPLDAAVEVEALVKIKAPFTR